MADNDNRRRFKHFHKRLSELPFAPDFLDSLARVMADPESCLDERVLAWAKYFAWGNYREIAVRLTSNGAEMPLRQRNCAEDLAWLEAGARVEWLDAPDDVRSAELARLGVRALDKTAPSRAIRSNEMRGTIDSETGYDIRPTVSPKLRTPDEPSDDESQYKNFLAHFQVEHFQEWQELEVARSTVKRLNIVVLSSYREWRASRRNSTPSYKHPEALETSATTTAPEPVVNTPHAVVVPHENEAGPVLEEIQQHGPTTLKAATKLLADCRERFHEAAPDDVIVVIQRVAESFSRHAQPGRCFTQNCAGVLPNL